MNDNLTEVTKTRITDVPKEVTDKIIRHHVWGSVGVSLIPIPVIDFVAITGIQLNMVRKLAKAYEVPFSRDKVKNILFSLAGGAMPTTASLPLASIVKTVPIIGYSVSIVTMPVISGAVTYAIGKVFVQHFASGGTFLTFDPEKARAYYADMLKEGAKVTALKKDETADDTDDKKVSAAQKDTDTSDTASAAMTQEDKTADDKKVRAAQKDKDTADISEDTDSAADIPQEEDAAEDTADKTISVAQKDTTKTKKERRKEKYKKSGREHKKGAWYQDTDTKPADTPEAQL